MLLPHQDRLRDLLIGIRKKARPFEGRALPAVPPLLTVHCADDPEAAVRNKKTAVRARLKRSNSQPQSHQVRDFGSPNPIPSPVNGGEPAQTTETAPALFLRPATPGSIQQPRQDRVPTIPRFSGPTVGRLLVPFAVFAFRIVAQYIMYRAICQEPFLFDSAVGRIRPYAMNWRPDAPSSATYERRRWMSRSGLGRCPASGPTCAVSRPG